jgi:hypothetical protein
MGSRVGVVILLSRKRSAVARLINGKFGFAPYRVSCYADRFVYMYLLRNNVTAAYRYDHEEQKLILNMDNERIRYWHSVKNNYRMLSIMNQDVSFGFQRVSTGISFDIYGLVDDVWTEGENHFYDNNHLPTIKFPELDYKNVSNLLDYYELVKEKR